MTLQEALESGRWFRRPSWAPGLIYRRDLSGAHDWLTGRPWIETYDPAFKPYIVRTTHEFEDQDRAALDYIFVEEEPPSPKPEEAYVH
jgi:hypothetical protein